MVGERAIIFNTRLMNMNFISLKINLKKSTDKNHIKKQALHFKISHF